MTIMNKKAYLILILVFLLTLSGCSGNKSENVNLNIPKTDVNVLVEDYYGNIIEDYVIFAWSKSYSKQQDMFMGAPTNEKGIATFYGLELEDWIFFYEGIYDYNTFSFESVEENYGKVVRLSKNNPLIKLKIDKEITDELLQTAEEKKDSEYEKNNANVILTIKDKNDNLIINEYIMIGSKRWFELAKKDNWNTTYIKLIQTDENGVLRTILEDDEYLIGLETIQTNYLSDYTKIPLNKKFKFINVKKNLEKTIIFDNDNELEKIQKEIKDSIQSELDKKEQEELDKIEQNRQEMCDPKNENALLLCCAPNYYNLFEGYQKFSSKEIKINPKYYSNKLDYEFIIDDVVVGNLTEKIFQSGNLLIEMLRCSGNPKSIREEDVFCCVKILGLRDNQKFVKLNQKNVINNKEILIDKDEDYKLYLENIEYILKEVLLIEDTLFKFNSSVFGVETDKNIGVILDIETTKSNDYLLSETETIELNNRTATIVKINPKLSIDVKVEFNQTTKNKIIEKKESVNGLTFNVKEIFDNYVWVSID
jgi:hypothetical protein